MLVRSLKVPPSLFLFIVFCAFLGWQLSQGPLDETPIEAPSSPRPAPEKEDAPPPTPPEEKKKEKEKAYRIALVTFVTEERSYVHLSLKNKDHYARRHGLDFIVDYEAHTDRGTTWYKYNMMERLIKSGKWDWIWWLDFDTLITNTAIKVTDVMDEELKNTTNPEAIDWLLTHDCNGLNTGSFIVRSNERSLKFLQDTFAIGNKLDEHGRNPSEQDAMAKLISLDKTYKDRTIQVPQWKLNAFPEEIKCLDESRQVWQHGTFILHFAGAWAHVKGDDPTGQLMRKYEHEIIWGDWKRFYNGALEG